MIDPLKINRDGCMICQRDTPIEPEPPMKMTALEAFGAYGFDRLYICEHCEPLVKQYDTEATRLLKEFIEKFMAEHCKIKE